MADPHEITNVLGGDGFQFMADDAGYSLLKIYFAVPSCVPATPLETNGAVFGADQVEKWLPRCCALGEMMNYVGVVGKDQEIVRKLQAAQKLKKPVDGHAPQLSGEQLRAYVAAGISTDHECSTEAEALEKLALGMKILIRDGSAARNYPRLKNLLKTHPDQVMCCTDDAHPDDIIARGHIDKFLRWGAADGVSVHDLVRACCFNPADHYGLKIGQLRPGDPADFILVDNLRDFTVKRTVINGECVYDGTCVTYKTVPHPIPPNNFCAR